MSRNSEQSSGYDLRGRMRGSPSPEERQTPSATTASHAARNVTEGNSTQFNSDVGRHMTATYSRDSLQIEDNSVQGGHLLADQGNLNVHFNFTQTNPQYGPVATPVLHPRTSPILTDTNRSLCSEQNSLLERRRSRSGGDMLDTQPSPSLPTPISASSSALPGITSNGLGPANQATIDAIKKKISEIYHLYDALPNKLVRFSRVPGLNPVRKDLNAQRGMFYVTVEYGDLIPCLERTLKTPRSLPHSVSASSYPVIAQQQTGVEDVQDRLDQIHRLLIKVEDSSDNLAFNQDKLNLPIRQRPRKETEKTNQARQQSPGIAVKGRAGVAKNQKRRSVPTKTKSNHTQALTHIVNMLTTRMEEFQKQCQRLQPPQYTTAMEDTFIPEDLGLTKSVAVMLSKALCQVCPNKNHVHQVLFGLSTQELSCDDERDTAIEFNLAFECPGESETWFVVQSTLKGRDYDEMDVVEQFNTTVRAESHSRPSFSQHLKDSTNAAEEPNARFCLQYYKQGTDDLAVALRHSTICEHQVFYPDQARLDIIRENGQAIPLRQLLEEDCHPTQRLEALEKVQLAKMLAEAVLKFHSTDWLSCKWDCDNILIHKIDGHLEPHLRFELWSPDAAEKAQETSPRSQQMSYVLYQLGILLGFIAVGLNSGCANYEIVQDGFGSTVYAEIMQTCLDMGQNENSLGDRDIRERFYSKVVAKLDELEDILKNDDGE